MHLKKSIVFKYERKNGYHRRGMLVLLSIRITACIFGYMISSLQLNGKFLENFM